MDSKSIKSESIWFIDAVGGDKDHYSQLYSLKSFEGRIYGRGEMYIDGRFGAVPTFFDYNLRE